MIDIDELTRNTIAHRDAGRIDEARVGYEKLIAYCSIRDDPHNQFRAATAEVWLARFDVDRDELPSARRHYGAAEIRADEAQRRFGANRSWMVPMLEVAAELAALDLGDGDIPAATTRITRALDAVQAEIPDRVPGIEEMVRLASLLFTNGGSRTSGDLLLQGFAHLISSEEPVLATEIYWRLGWLYEDAGDGDAALDAYIAGGLIVEGLNDRDADLAEATMYHSIGSTTDKRGQYAIAAFAYQKAFDLRRRWLDADDPHVLLSRYNLAELARVSGDTEFAQSELAAVADGLRNAPDSETSLQILALKNLAVAALQNNRGDTAERAASEALSLAPSMELRGELLGVLGQVRLARGEKPGIAKQLAEVADVARREHGEGSTEHMYALLELACFLPDRKADRLFKRIVATLRDSTSFEARNVWGNASFNLGATRWARDDVRGAFAAFAGSVPVFEDLRAEQWRTRSALEMNRPEPWPLTTPLVRLVATRLPDSPDACQLAFRQAVGSKRLQAEMLARQQELILEGNHDLIGVRELAAKFRRSRASVSGDARRTDELAELEKRLAREVPRSALIRIGDESSAQAVAEALPPHSALIEYISLADFSDSPIPGVRAQPRSYVAFVLTGDPEKLTVVDLGPAAVIENAIDQLRNAIPQGALARESWRSAARALAELIWDPLVPHLQWRRGTFIAPDGALCAVPFDALITSDGKPLLATTTIALVATGRDIHRFRTRANWRTTGPVIFAAPDFGEPWEPFGPLIGSVQEGAAIADQLAVDPIMGDEATPEALLNAANAEILHLATHAYYLASTPVTGLSGLSEAALTSHPLLNSGIALAGANADLDGLAPGVITALDIIGLDLAGTDLVVLSACESGLGVLDGAEGLLGLARSFVLGGARSVVWSLWRVDDVASAELMTEFYRWLLDESPRSEALRAAKLSAYTARPERVDVWASFVLQGDPSELLRHRVKSVPDSQIYSEPLGALEGFPVPVADTRGRPFSMFTTARDDGEPMSYMEMNGRDLELGLAEIELRDGQQALMQGRIVEAKRHFAIGLERVLDETRGLRVRSLLQRRLAIVAGMERDWPVARAHGLAAVEGLSRIAGADEDLAVVLDNLALAEASLGDLHSGRARLEQALALKRMVFPPGDSQIEYTLEVIAQIDAALRK